MSTSSTRSALAGVLIGFAAAAAFFTATRPEAQGQAPTTAPGKAPEKAPGKGAGQGAGQGAGRGRIGGPPAETTIPDKVRLFIPYKDYSQEDNQRVLALYKWLRVADISDGMDHVGLQDVGLVHQDIHALWKDTEKFTHRRVGIAVTARYVPTNKREPKMTLEGVSRWYGTITNEAFQQALTPGSMLVIDAMEDGETRSIGSNNIMAWTRAGMVGLVTSGGLADTDEIIAEKVPVWFRRLARGFRPGRNEIESVNRPVTIGGVLVRPGDVVAADGDGVIVVPREQAEEVAKEAFRYVDQIQRELYIKETGQNPWAPAGRGRGGQ